ncbi:MAG: isopeptide-forming domain-containing fimbrial protein, partial [Desulfobacterales bacterium]
MKENFFFQRLISGLLLTFDFFQQCRSRVMPLKKTKQLLRADWICAALSALVLLLASDAAFAAPCDIKNNPPPFIRNDLTDSYCELCSYGYITVVISNPYEGADMTNMTVVENLRSSGLTFASSAPTPMRVNGAPVGPGSWPNISGANNQILTWTPAQVPQLGGPLPFQLIGFNTLSITFAVTRAAGFNQEGLGLVSTDRDIQARLIYSARYETFPPTNPATYVTCPGMPRTESTGLDELPLREPDPEVFKRGRNVDADQETTWTQTVYGNINDDVIWRIQVRNDGQAGLQDLRFDDLMPTGNFDINYMCPSETAAQNIADNNGVDPGGGGCIALPNGNSISNFDVDNPFGNPGNDSPDRVDVRDGRSAHIYLVGKIPGSPNGSCSANRTNTVSDIQWGCEGEGSAGGLNRTSTGSIPAAATATLSSLSVNSGNNLNVRTEIIGTNTSQPAGSKGTVRITIRNTTGGTVKGITLRDVLPSEYVVDSTFTPSIAATGAYGYYPGLTNRIEWTNPVADTFPLTTSDPAVALANTAPEFRLYSSEPHPIYADQVDMLRHGDRLVITFRIVLIRPQSYDRVANLDVRTEAPNSDPPGTDPANSIQLTNQLYVDFQDFCNPGVIKHPPNNPLVTTHQSNPEDLDINIAGSELVFILTGDPTQRLPLTVNLRNNGGHDAADYVTYVTFGATMDVVAVPAGCSPTSNPPPHEEWRIPAPIPAGTTVYQCTGPPIAPGQTVALNFEVIKSTNPADLSADDLTFRADGVGEITLSDGTPLWFPAPVNPRADGGTDDANNYSLDGVRARVVGFNLLKSQVGTCSENNPPPTSPDLQVQIGEECTYHIDTGGWFGFQTPGFTYIAVQRIQVFDQLPDGQGYISSTDPYPTSTSAIKGISLNPASLAPPNEVAAPEWMNWTFNQVVPIQRIDVRDHWFRADMTSRLLNDPIDVSAAPNRHSDPSVNTLTSYFQAVFNNDVTGMEEIYDLGPSTVGYPRVEVRRIALTVTEPQITVVKEVCNESLHGTGPTCAPFVPLAADGDAYDHYIYRLTLTNEAISGGVQRAPAYDVTVTDRLDASDLAYVLPFDADGLDNDGDGAIDEADEGVISDNIVRNGTSAVITFAYTHSSPLLRINPGQSVQLYYRVDYDDDAAPLQTFTNTADATYDSLEGLSGNQSAPQRLNSDIGGARFYTSPPGSAAVRVIPVQTQPKRITALSNTPVVGAGSTQGVSIGEEIEYRLNTLLPVALLRNFVIRDELPAGMRCSEAPEVNLNAAPYSAANFVPGGIFTPTCNDNFVEWNFGDQRVTNGTVGNRYDFEIGFIARAENTAGTNDADVLSNGDPATTATASYIDESGNPVVLTFGRVDVVVREPRIELTKAFAVAAADAGDFLTVTVRATNTGTATAYNLRVLDDLTGRNLTFMGIVGGSNPPGNIDTTTLGANRPIFSWNPPNGIDPGATIGFTFDVRVDTAAQPLEVLDNTIQADWTSLPGQSTALNSTGMIGADGSESGLRIGALPNAGDAVNDYETNAEHQATVPAVTLTKTDLDPALIPAIGGHKSFQVDIHLPEGTTQGVLVTDSLNAAGISYFIENNAGYDITYAFQGIATINGSAPGEAAFNAFPADGTSGSAVWDIGTVVTQTENDPSESAIAPLIRIQYYARVNNDLVTDSGDMLQNSVVVNHTHGETGAQETLTDATASVTVVESLLSVTKTMSNVTSPGNPAGGGDVLEYVIVSLNSGTATAYDVNLVDTLPAQLSLDPGFTPTALINGVPVAGFVATPASAPNGPLVWGRENADGSLDIPVGQSLVLTYRLVVQEVGGDLNNSVWTDWTSLDGTSSRERTGEGCPGWTAPNDYCTGPAVATTTTVDENSILKAIPADTYDVPPLSTAVDAIARVGDTITYRLALNLRGGLTRNVQVQDALPGGMAVVDMVSINGDTTAAYTSPATGPGSNFAYAPISAANVPAAGQTGTLTWTIGDVVNNPLGDPTTDALEIIYRARILPDSGIAHVSSTTLNNTASLSYVGAPPLDSSAVVTLHQPVIAQVTKTDRGGRTSPASVNVTSDNMQFRLEACNSGQAPAYSVEVIDQLAGQLDETSIVNLAVSVGGVALNAGSDYTYTPPAARGGRLNFLLNTSVNPTQCVTIDYDIGFHTDFGPNQVWNNSVTVDAYWSLPAQSGQRYGPVGPAIFSMNNLATIEPPAKTILSPASAEAAIGQEIVYRITVPVTPMNAALNDVRILDDLNSSAADLSFVRVAKVSGSQPWTPVNTGTATNLVIEDTTTGIDIPAGEQIVLDITVVLEDTPTNVSGLQFNNTAAYTYNAINGDPSSQAPGGSDTTPDITIVGPDALTLEKSGPATMQVGTPAGFTLNVHNPSTGTAWNPVITDRLPHGATGGMCAAGPSNVAAQIFLADGVTPASAQLVEGTDFTVSFSGQSSCEWQFSLLSSVGGLAPDQRLIVRYDLELDLSTENGLVLANVAGVTQWFSADPGAAGAAPRTYDRELTDGTPGTLDHEDSHSVTCEAPILAFSKNVQNMTTGQNPGRNASPGDTLRYTIQLSNSGPVGVSSFSIMDEVDRLNPTPVFASGSLNL